MLFGPWKPSSCFVIREGDTTGFDERYHGASNPARAKSGLVARLQALHAAGNQTLVGTAFGGVDWDAVFGWFA